jgi:hypothetical protein
LYQLLFVTMKKYLRLLSFKYLLWLTVLMIPFHDQVNPGKPWSSGWGTRWQWQSNTIHLIVKKQPREQGKARVPLYPSRTFHTAPLCETFTTFQKHHAGDQMNFDTWSSGYSYQTIATRKISSPHLCHSSLSSGYEDCKSYHIRSLGQEWAWKMVL